MFGIMCTVEFRSVTHVGENPDAGTIVRDAAPETAPLTMKNAYVRSS
ncbi:hypothetical protein AB0M36_09580 [Actinoplanes sp. NPDC051346]